MSLSESEIKHLAQLARLELKPVEIKNFSQQLGDVLEYVAKVQSLSAQVPAPALRKGVQLRADEVRAYPEQEKLIKLAPQQEKNMIIVPEVFSDEK